MLPNPILTIGPLSVHMYGLMIAIGILFCFLVLFYLAKKIGLEEKYVDFIFYDGVFAIVLGFAGAMLVQATLNYMKHPEEGFHFGQGMTFLGGVIIGAGVFILTYFLFRKKFIMQFFDLTSIAPPCIFIAHAFGRIGCFFAGCCYGKPTDSFLGVTFPGFSGPVHPTQLYEAAFLFIMFGVTTFLLLKYHFRYNLPLYMMSYGVFRFLLEYVRGDDRGANIGIFSPSQFWSIFLVLGAVGLYFLYRKMYTAHADKSVLTVPEKTEA